ncbi:MAG: polymer-forming cytoskeletal protein [Hyphomicrobiaceae bacterium]|nr:polymer-forming cytoskeletal protein [Hyphomicrobiaceae bacterium]
MSTSIDKTKAGTMIVSEGDVVTAEIRNCRNLVVFGYVEGDVVTDELVVHEGGQLFGRVKAGTADISGTVQGNIEIRNLCAIRATADVAGNVQYGRLSVEPGGSLTAEVRNVPPRLIGDFSITVSRGGTVRLTTLDIAAVDPDNAASELTFRITNATGGHVAMSSAPASSVEHFTQADVERGDIIFVHDGGSERRVQFDVVVTDAAGASSGSPKTVEVVVADRAAA